MRYTTVDSARPPYTNSRAWEGLLQHAANYGDFARLHPADADRGVVEGQLRRVLDPVPNPLHRLIRRLLKRLSRQSLAELKANVVHWIFPLRMGCRRRRKVAHREHTIQGVATNYRAIRSDGRLSSAER